MSPEKYAVRVPLEEIFAEGPWHVLAAGYCASAQSNHMLVWRLAHAACERSSDHRHTLDQVSSMGILIAMDKLRSISRTSMWPENPPQEISMSTRIADELRRFWQRRGQSQAQEMRRGWQLEQARETLGEAVAELLRLGAEAQELHAAVDLCLARFVHEG